ncbi:MAG: ABC transporter substrate-binding protein [Janthinobacterium lividum]
MNLQPSAHAGLASTRARRLPNWRHAALLTALGLAPLVCSAQSQEPVQLGLLLAKQGFVAESAIDSANGALLEIEEHGSKVLGRPIKVVWYDDPNPQGAQQNMTRLVEQDKVVAVVGGSTSPSSFAMSAIAARAKIPTMIVTGSAHELTGSKCNRYTFRTQLTADVGSRALAPELMKHGKKWYFVSANYAYGQEVLDTSRKYLKDHGGTEVGSDLVPNGTTDFSSLILKIREANPDVVVVGLGGGDVDNFVKQFAQYGGKAELGTPLITDSSIWGSGDAARGLYGKQWHYSDSSNSQDEKNFVKAWRAKYNDKPPSTGAWQGWMSMRILLAGIEQAKTTDGPAVAKALESVKLDGGAMPNYYRAWDHQFIHQIDIARAHPPVAGRDKWDMLDIVTKVPSQLADVDSIYGSQEQVGCKLGDF